VAGKYELPRNFTGKEIPQQETSEQAALPILNMKVIEKEGKC
jgi:hypothetical protein